jgi:hypothetical protein
MLKKSILLLGTLFVFSDASGTSFPKSYFEEYSNRIPTPNTESSTEIAEFETEFAQTEFGKMMSAQIERLKQDSNRNTEVFDEEEHDEIKQDNGEKTEPLAEEKVDVMEMLIELMEKERRDAFQRSREDRDFMRLLP